MSAGKLIDIYPEIARQLHPTKNDIVNIEDLTCYSSTSVWWKCDKGDDHEWKTSVRNRTKLNSGCPYCAGQRACARNNLEKMYPDIARQWSPNNSTPAHQVLPHTQKKAEWVCELDSSHIWIQKVTDRVKSKFRCPICTPSSKIFTRDKALVKTHPKLMKEWNWEENNKDSICPSKLVAGSTMRAHWLCVEGHKWQAQIRHRTKSKSACPYCIGRKAHADDNLALNNKELLSEWDYQKNKDIDPEKIKSGSGIRVWWQCRFGHSWKTDVYSRAVNGTQCPFCSSQTSSPEIRIYTELEGIGIPVTNRTKILGTEVDVLVDNYIGLEYDGCYYHANKKEKDLEKNVKLKKSGIEIIRIREEPLKKLGPNDMVVSSGELIKENLNDIVKILFNLGALSKSVYTKYLEAEDFINDSEYRRVLSYLPSPTPECSLAETFREHSSNWDYEKNHPLTPLNFTPRSNKKVYWKCKTNPDHVWQNTIGTEVNRKYGCPYCAKKRASKEYNLEVSYPEIALEWDYERNELAPSDVLPNYGKKVWWRCKKNQTHRWENTPNGRVSKQAGCPVCSGRVATETDNLEVNNPEVLKIWDYEMNDTAPNQFKSGSGQKAYWRCKSYPYHRWQSVINSVVNSFKKTGSNACPYCSGKKNAPSRQHTRESTGNPK